MRYRMKVKLQFRKDGSTHTSVNTFWGDTPEECRWHCEVLIETWEGWTLTIREELEVKTFRK